VYPPSTVSDEAPRLDTEPLLTPQTVAVGKSERVALRMLQVGAVAVVLAATTYKVFELDRYFVPKELTLHLTALLAGLFAIRAFRRATIGWVDVLLVGYLLLSLVSALFATNGWLAVRALTISASGIAIFWAARALRDAGLARPLLTGLAVAVVVGACTSLLQTFGVNTDLFSVNRAPGGTLGNRNFVAHMAAFGLPIVLLATLRAARRRDFIFGAVGVTIVTASLVLTRSRAAWLAFGAVIVVLPAALLVSPLLRRHRTTWLRLAVTAVMAAVGVAAALFAPNTLRWRSENPYLDSMRDVANYQAGSGHGRLVQYGQSLRLLARDPVFGVGPGNWPVEYPAHAAAHDPSLDPAEPGRTSNPWPSSDWVAFAAERGPLAMILLALALAGIAFGGFHQLVRARDADDGLAASALLGTLVAVGVAGMFDAVLLLALPTLLVWAALGALWSPAPSRFNSLSSSLRASALIAVAVIAGLGALRSTAQLVAMGVYFVQDDVSSWSQASRIDPGNYRIHLRLARNGRQRCSHARAAHALFPSAGEARGLSRRCSSK
jgi:hypothetical protein